MLMTTIKKNSQTKQNHYKPTHKKQKNIDWKSNGPLNIPIPKNFKKTHFLMQHHLIFPNEKKTPILRTFELILECKL